jgi:hypothetical protein
MSAGIPVHLIVEDVGAKVDTISADEEVRRRTMNHIKSVSVSSAERALDDDLP